MPYFSLNVQVYEMIMRGCLSLAYENFAFGELEMLNFTSFCLKSKLKVYDFLGVCMPPCLIKICKIIIFKVFSHWRGRLCMLGGILGSGDDGA